MSFAEIENVWRSPRNRPSAAELEKQKKEFVADLRHRRRRSLGLLCLTFLPLAFITGKLAAHVFWPDPRLDAVDLGREWGVLPFFALPWIGWFYLVRLHWRHHVEHAQDQRSIGASVAALLDENRAERTRCKAVGALLIASVVVLPLVVFQLRAVGKAGDEILLLAFVVYPAYVAGVLVWLAFHHRRKLKPRQHELETLLQAYGEAQREGDARR